MARYSFLTQVFIYIGIIKLAIMPTVPINYTMDATQQYCESKKFGSFTSCAKSNYIYVVCIWNLHNALMQETYLSHTSTHTWLMDHHATYICGTHKFIRTWYIQSNKKSCISLIPFMLTTTYYKAFSQDICFPCIPFIIILIPLAQFYYLWHNL